MMTKKIVKLAIILFGFFSFSLAFSAPAEFCYALNTDLGHFWVIFAYNKDDSSMLPITPLYRLYLKNSKKAICFTQNANINSVKLADEQRRRIKSMMPPPGSLLMSAGFYRVDPFKYEATYMSKYMYEFHLRSNCTSNEKIKFSNIEDTASYPDKEWNLAGNLSFNYDGGLWATSHMKVTLLGAGNLVLRPHVKLNGHDLPGTGLAPGVYDTSITHCGGGQTTEISFQNRTLAAQTHSNDKKHVFSSPWK